MFNGDDAFSKYLSMQPFGQLHAAFLLDTNVQPIWLTSEEFSNVKNARNLGHGLGLKHDELCTLLQEQHCAPKTNLTLDSSDIDFSQ